METAWVKRHLTILLKGSPNWTRQIYWSLNHEITTQFNLMQGAKFIKGELGQRDHHHPPSSTPWRLGSQPLQSRSILFLFFCVFMAIMRS